MSDNTRPVPLTTDARADQVFPTLTPPQVARISAHGRVRQVQPGEVLVEAGEQSTKFFVVTAGQLRVVRRVCESEELVAVFGPGQFTGEMNVLSGRRGIAQIRAASAGEVIEVERESLLGLVQTDSELSDILMRAFILRRVELIAQGIGDVVLVGSNYAATFLAKTARRVHVLVRSDGLAESMSRYLIRRLEESPSVDLRTRTEIVALEGNGHLERVRLRDNRTGEVETRNVRHVFVMTGAVPNTGWLDGCVALNAKGFIKTGADLSPDDLAAARWPLARAPYLLETSLPGVFAVGDVRAGNIKRVASAVGEGSIAVSLVHQVLHE
jgi:CRP-like cAMP-binding protein